MASKLSVQITVGPSTVKIQMDDDGYQSLMNELKSKSDWITVYGVDGSELNLNRKEVLAVRAFETQEQKGNIPGVTVTEICKVAPTKWKYPTLVRKVNKPGGIELEMASDRRILLSDENMKRLGLSYKQIEALKKIETKRTFST